MEEELLAAEVLKVRVLNPAVAQLFVGEIEGVFEDCQPRHQPCGQRRHAGAIGINLAALLFDKAPRHRLRQCHQFVLQVDDLIQA